ncbi:uncharacterized protein LOC142892330 isoform X1 [Nelusetta ayraudi]|uniref:uncharacterized protein LOC142892330 isoform X1 n=1 Tax=Nelusetta ayraudi TaxID=303726 RepID=UPI003F722BC0
MTKRGFGLFVFRETHICVNGPSVSLKSTQEPIALEAEFLSMAGATFRETRMPSAEYLKELVRGRLAAAAEEIFAVFHRVIVDYEKELEQHRKLFDAACKPVVMLRRIEIPQQLVCKEEVIVEDQAPLNQDKNSSQDQEKPEPPQIKEQQEEESSFELKLKQEPEDLHLCSAEEESIKSEDQTVKRHCEESDVKSVVITSVVSEANSDLQQLSLSAGVSPSRAQKEGEQEIESEILNQRPVGKNQRVSTTDGSGFSSPGTSLQKKVIRTRKKQHVCKECGKSFPHLSNLVVHNRVHTGERPFVCQTCAKGFPTKAQLELHKMTHTGEKPYACDTCGKRFKTKLARNLHNTVHTGERPHVCDTCGKSFIRPAELSIHKRSHTGERPYVCDTCEKRFLTQRNLTFHNRIHTGERPYVCHTCGKRFARKMSLIAHNRIHTGEKPFVCKECGKGFISSNAFAYHVRSAH